jgi:hypothetical protein
MTADGQRDWRVDGVRVVRGAVVLVVAFAIAALGIALTAGLALALRR